MSTWSKQPGDEAKAAELGFARAPGEPETWNGPDHACVSLDEGDEGWSAFDRNSGDLVDDGYTFWAALHVALGVQP